jgi:hypothetical protein
MNPEVMAALIQWSGRGTWSISMSMPPMRMEMAGSGGLGSCWTGAGAGALWCVNGGAFLGVATAAPTGS